MMDGIDWLLCLSLMALAGISLVYGMARAGWIERAWLGSRRLLSADGTRRTADAWDPPRPPALPRVEKLAPDSLPTDDEPAPAPAPPAKPSRAAAEAELTPKRRDPSSLTGRLIAADPQSTLARRLNRGGAPGTPPQRLEWVAREMGGQAVVVESSVAGHATWTFLGRRYYYYEITLENGAWTFIATRTEQVHLPRFQLRVRNGATPFPPLRDVWPDPLGVPRFDGIYELCVPGVFLRAGPPALPDIFAAFASLEAILGPRHVLEAGGHRCRLAILGACPGPEDLRRLLPDACRLLDRIVTQHAGEAEATGCTPLPDALCLAGEGTPVCRVCGEGLVGARMDCARCGAPHHEDCWSYVGGCAIYACLSHDGVRREMPAAPGMR